MMITVPLPVLTSILVNEPLCLIWLVGLGMAWIQRHDHPKVSWLVSIALLLLLLQTAAGIYLDLWIPVLLYQHLEQLPPWLFRVLMLNEPIQLAIQTLAWGLLLFATFNWRTSRW